MAVLHHSIIPLYYQISRHLQSKIDSGELPPGYRLPSETEIANQFGVSVITARAALRVLHDKKLVVRYRGKGTFVTQPGPPNAVWGLGSLDDIIAIGLQSELALLSRTVVYPPPWVVEKLKISPRRQVYMLRTMRRSGGEPFMITELYHSPEIGKTITESDLSSLSARNKLVITIIEEKLGVKAVNMRQTMSAEEASSSDAHDLGIVVGQPLLVVDRDYVTTDGRVIQVGRSRYRTDRYRYVINLSRAESSELSRVESGWSS